MIPIENIRHLDTNQIEEMGNLVIKGDTMQENLDDQADNFSLEFQEFKKMVRGIMKTVKEESAVRFLPPPSPLFRISTHSGHSSIHKG